MLAPTQTPAALTDLVEALKEAWRGGAPPDAAGALRAHPELLGQRSLAVDLAYEEYCLLEEAGCPPEPEPFCERLPAFRSQVREVIRGHRVFADHPELLAAAAVEWPAPGDDFEGLAVVRELGRGGFARAYLARDPATGDRPVVLKLSPAPSGEARTLGPLAHPHIVAVHWAKRVRGLHAICMPFVGASTLGDVIEAAFRHPRARSARTLLGAIDGAAVTAPPPALLTGRESYPDAVAAVGARLAGALAHLHRAGVCHGDLKPSNVILAPGGHPYLIDFNLATGPDGVLLRLGGTLPYMAPERVPLLLGDANPHRPAPTDVYSLGAVLFESLAGRVPFPPAALADPAAVARDMARQQAAPAPDVATFDPAVPRALARIVARCLARDPRARPTAAALERALARYLRRRTRRAGAVLAFGGLAAVALVVGQLSAGTPLEVSARPEPAPAAVSPEPVVATDSFSRGVERLRAGDVATATKHFGDARRAHPDGRSTAFLAYCMSLTGRDAAAAALYQNAIKDYNYGPAWVHNNRAYNLIRCGSPQNVRLAVGEADAALALAPHLRAARLNRAYARFLAELDPQTQTLANPEPCLTDLEAVLSEGPYTAELYYRAALILTAAAAERGDYYARAVGYLREAVRLGWSSQHVAQEPVFQPHLAGRKDFQQVIELPHAEGPEFAGNIHVVDPLGL